MRRKQLVTRILGQMRVIPTVKEVKAEILGSGVIIDQDSAIPIFRYDDFTGLGLKEHNSLVSVCFQVCHVWFQSSFESCCVTERDFNFLA
jgi:hypothetical protein